MHFGENQLFPSSIGISPLPTTHPIHLYLKWLTLLFSIPLVLSFMGEWGRGIVADGFTALAGMPQWYQIALGAIVSASFATRSASKLFNMRKKK